VVTNSICGPDRHDIAPWGQVTEIVARVAERPRAPWGYRVALGVSLALLGVFLLALGHVLTQGTGVWGITSPVAWGFDVTCFVYWIGIGHAGTLISAILLLLRQPRRTTISRIAESMTLFALLTAALFPVIHVGRPWLVYWMLPYPNQMGLWPQFRSALTWDVFAILAYAATSFAFWYLGLVPDLATWRDRAVSRHRRLAFGLLALGWRGSAREWHRYQRAYLLLAGLATPLVICVHSVVSFDFATSLLPGWHSTIFPVYFVVGALFGGIAMVMVLLVPVRRLFRLEALIELRHLDFLSRLLIAGSLLVAYAYLLEWFMAWYGGSSYERFVMLNRGWGDYAWAYWPMLAMNLLAPQLLWFARFRRHPTVVFLVGLTVNVGMWLERYVIVTSALSRDFLPSSWGRFVPTRFDLMTLAGSFGLFFSLFLLLCRHLPLVAIAEAKAARELGDRLP
jgi:molybdopterin-containing oxidoreductase family membrane subunit